MCVCSLYLSIWSTQLPRRVTHLLAMEPNLSLFLQQDVWRRSLGDPWQELTPRPLVKARLSANTVSKAWAGVGQNVESRFLQERRNPQISAHNQFPGCGRITTLL